MADNTQTRIEGTPSGTLDVKRFFMHGVKLIASCPNCGHEIEDDFGHDYLGYPEVNHPFDRHCYCSACEHEWTVKLTLALNLTVMT